MFRTSRPLLLCLLLCLSLLLPACGSKANLSTSGQPQVQQSQSPQSLGFRSVKLAFEAYDFGMSMARDLRKANIITEAQWVQVREKVGRPFYKAIVFADSLLNQYGATDPQNPKLVQALQAMANSQKEFEALVNSFDGGK